MKNLQMPHSYISVSEEELRSISGGGPLGDALDLFFSNLRLDDLFFSGGLISLSFTFVPMLLFNVVKTGFNFVVSAYDTIADLFHFSHEERDMVQYISDQQQPLQRLQSQERSRCRLKFEKHKGRVQTTNTYSVREHRLWKSLQVKSGYLAMTSIQILSFRPSIWHSKQSTI